MQTVSNYSLNMGRGSGIPEIMKNEYYNWDTITKIRWLITHYYEPGQIDKIKEMPESERESFGISVLQERFNQAEELRNSGKKMEILLWDYETKLMNGEGKIIY